MNTKRDTIVLFLGESDFGNIASMVAALADGFREAGLKTTIIDVRKADYGNKLAAVAAAETAAALVCVSGFGLPPSPDSPAVARFNEMGVSVIGVFLDHPFCLRDRIDLPLKDYHACFPAAHAVDFCKRFIRPGPAYHHLAHGGVPREPLDWSARDIPMILTGSLFMPPEEQRRRWHEHGLEVETRLNDITDLVWQDLSRPLESCVLEVLGGDPDFDTIFPYMKTVDDFVRNAQRLDVVRALASLPLTVVGPGWGPYAESMPGVCFVGETTIQETLALMDRAKVVLNPFPGYNDSHERVFNAMAGGAAVLTSRSTYYVEAFAADEIFFLPNRSDGLAQWITPLMKDDDRVSATALAGRRRFMREHTWACRAERLCHLAGL